MKSIGILIGMAPNKLKSMLCLMLLAFFAPLAVTAQTMSFDGGLITSDGSGHVTASSFIGPLTGNASTATSAGSANNAPASMTTSSGAVPVLLANPGGALTASQVIVSNSGNDIFIPGNAVIAGSTVASAAFTSSNAYDAAGSQIAVSRLLGSTMATNLVGTNNVLWWGADNTGRRDSTSAFQNWINYAITNNAASGGAMRNFVTFQMPEGKYLISGQLIFSNLQNGITFEGSGDNTVLQWCGSTNTFPILVLNCVHCNFQNFELLCTNLAGSGFPYGIGIASVTGSFFGTDDKFEGITIKNVGNGGFGGGFNESPFTGQGVITSDNGNDRMHYIRCVVVGALTNAFFLSGANAHNVIYDSCNVRSSGTAIGTGLFSDGAGYEWHMGFMSMATNFAFLHTPIVPVVIDHLSAENTCCFFCGETGTGAFDENWSMLKISNCRVTASPSCATNFINLPGGWVIFENNIIGDTPTPPYWQINYQPQNYQKHRLIMVDNIFSTAAGLNLFSDLNGTLSATLACYSRNNVVAANKLMYNIPNYDCTGGWSLYGGLSLAGGSLTVTNWIRPNSPQLNTAGTPGSTTYGYVVTAVNFKGEESTNSVVATINTGNATLDTNNYIVVGASFNGQNFNPGVDHFNVYRTNSPAGCISTNLRNNYLNLGQHTSIEDSGLPTNGMVLPARDVTADASFAGNVAIGGALSAAAILNVNTNGSGNIANFGDMANSGPSYITVNGRTAVGYASSQAYLAAPSGKGAVLAGNVGSTPAVSVGLVNGTDGTTTNYNARLSVQGVLVAPTNTAAWNLPIVSFTSTITNPITGGKAWVQIQIASQDSATGTPCVQVQMPGIDTNFYTMPGGLDSVLHTNTIYAQIQAGYTNTVVDAPTGTGASDTVISQKIMF